MQCVAEHWLFETIVIMLVLTNTVVLSMQYYGMSTTYEDRLDSSSWPHLLFELRT